MIYTVSARTDIPAFHTAWFINNLRKGEVAVRNPYYPEKVSYYDLKPSAVDCFCFLSKNYAPLLPYMQEIISQYPVLCDFTITPYETEIEPKVPPIPVAIQCFRELSNIVGPKRVNWRYDPIFFHGKYNMDYHKTAFAEIARNLSGYTNVIYFSFVSMYQKVQKNFPDIQPLTVTEKEQLLDFMLQISQMYGFTLRCCPSQIQDLNPDYANKIDINGCITAEIINNANGTHLKSSHAKNNRMNCGCITNKDIGAYDTCYHDCKYCYANSQQGIAYTKNPMFNAESPILCDSIKSTDIIYRTKQKNFQ